MNERSSLQLNSGFSKDSALVFLKQKWWLVALIVAAIGLMCFFIYSYIDTKNQLTQITKESGKEDASKLTAEIGAHIELPAETPSVATISDISKLSEQEFFKNGQNGDRVLVFSEAGRALLYRPSSKKVIEYSKIDLNNAPKTQ